MPTLLSGVYYCPRVEEKNGDFTEMLLDALAEQKIVCPYHEDGCYMHCGVKGLTYERVSFFENSD